MHGKACFGIEVSLMKTLVAVLVLVAGFACARPVAAQFPDEVQERIQQAEMNRDELYTIEKETVRALQLNNATFFHRVYSDDFFGISPSGQALDKVAYVASVQSSPVHYTSFVAADIRIRLYQYTAVVTCSWSAFGTQGGKPFAKQSRVTHVYVFGQRGWQAVSSQETALPG
jgi:Domain of unknown function (DUF4440)